MLELRDEEISRAYDPRITCMDGQYYVCFAVDTRHGVRGGIFSTHDFHHFAPISLSVPDNRNMVLFPEKIGGKYVRLERPMPVYSTGGHFFDIWLSDSPDLAYWGNSRLVLSCRDVPFCNDKIGPGAPPLKTDAGWLVIFHSVDVDPARGKNGWEDAWRKRYVIGVMLLDLEDPSRVIGLCKVPLMAPEGPEEQIEGFRTNALFPCGMILEDDQTGALLQRERHGGALGHGQARRPDLALHGKTLNPKMGLPRLRQPQAIYCAVSQSSSETAGKAKSVSGSKSRQSTPSRLPLRSQAPVSLSTVKVSLNTAISRNGAKTVPGWRSGFASNSRTEPSLKYTYT